MGSTVPRRQLGRSLREARTAARFTVRAAAKALEWSEPKLWRIETGQVSMRSLDVEAMCRTYGVAPDLTAALMGLAKETKARGWWHAYGDVVPGWFDVYVGLESAARELRMYESEMVPGLFQTAAYARVVIGTHLSRPSSEMTERRVLLRMQRQSIVTRSVDPVRLDVVIGEAALRRPVGDRPTMLPSVDTWSTCPSCPTCGCAWPRSAMGGIWGATPGRSSSCDSRCQETAGRSSRRPFTCRATRGRSISTARTKWLPSTGCSPPSWLPSRTRTGTGAGGCSAT